MHRRAYGTRRDAPDERDLVYAVPHDARRGRFPERVDLRASGAPVYDQQSLNSCSANAIAAALRFEHLRNGDARPFNPSRLFLYFNERSMEHHIAKNVPVSLRHGYKTIARVGICHEHDWPYRVRHFAVRPPRACYRKAMKHRAIRYMRLRQDLLHVRHCLADGYPFTVGITVYSNFHSRRVERTGSIPMPRRGEKMLGGHAVLVVGYDDAHEHVIAQNSWGRGWADRGYFYLPYDFLLSPDHAWDLWTVRRMNDEQA